MRTYLLLCVAILGVAAPSFAQSILPPGPQTEHDALERDRFATRFAARVVDRVQGAGPGVFVEENILGPPRGLGLGTGSLDVLSLGAGGAVTVGFDVVLCDGPGTDFIVFENAFQAGPNVFAEVCFVEVSSDGLNFARFAAHYRGPVGPLGPFGTVPIGSYSGLAGALPVLANAETNTLSAFDSIDAGGDAFDLSDLADDPAVTGGLVDLDAIHFVRLIDIVEGTEVDVDGNLIWDGGAPSGADIDAVAVVQHTGNQSAQAPVVELTQDALGFIELTVSDADGVLSLAPLRAQDGLLPVPFARLEANLFDLVAETSDSLHWRSQTPQTGLGLLSISVRDHTGRRTTERLVLQAP